MYQQHQFSCPIITGWGTVSVLGEKILELGKRRPLVVCDKGIVEAGITEKVGTVLREVGMSGLACLISCARVNPSFLGIITSSTQKIGRASCRERV